jgi:hypothetical protein
MGPFSFEEFTNLRLKKSTHLSLKTELHEMRNMKQLRHWYWKCGFCQLMCRVLLGCAGLVGREYWVRAYWWCGK